MSLQFDAAFQCFVDVYGNPMWETNPRDGQSTAQIIRTWENELAGYTVEQVREACYRVIRFKKSMTFPTISHLMAELVDVPKVKVEEEKKDAGGYICPEVELYKQVQGSATFPQVRAALVRMVADFRFYYPELSHLGFSSGLLKAMQNNGFWGNKILEYVK